MKLALAELSSLIKLHYEKSKSACPQQGAGESIYKRPTSYNKFRHIIISMHLSVPPY